MLIRHVTFNKWRFTRNYNCSPFKISPYFMMWDKTKFQQVVAKTKCRLHYQFSIVLVLSVRDCKRFLCNPLFMFDSQRYLHKLCQVKMKKISSFFYLKSTKNIADFFFIKQKIENIKYLKKYIIIVQTNFIHRVWAKRPRVIFHRV